MKKSIALLISFLMVLTLLPAVAWADVTDWSGVVDSNETEIRLSTSVTINGGNYDLTGKTVTFSGKATISGSVTITGGEILRGAYNYGALFEVGSGSSLTLRYITVDGQKDTVTANMPLVNISMGGTVTLGEGATLTNNKSNGGGEGSAVTVDDGSLHIDGGSIKDNETTAYTNSGGTIKTYHGATVTMTDGEISGNSGAKHGGAIQLYGANRSVAAETKPVTFTMSGGTISGNSLGFGSGVGGGVAISNNATFVMTGGTITGNSCGSSGKGGGVAFADGNNTSMEIYGSAVIDGNKKGSAENNLEIGTNTNNLLKVTGALSGANIGITRTNNSTNVFTTSESGITPADYIDQFSSDNTDYYVDNDGSGQLQLKETPNTIIISTNFSETANAGAELTVAASVTGSTAVSYQWYSCTGKDKSGASAISGAMSSTYTVPTDLSAGDHYYFCRVSADGANPVDSNVVRVTVEEPAVIEAKWGASASNLTNSGTLSAAFAASPAYVQLQTSVKLNEGIIVSSGTTTLDLNGKTITGKAGINATSPNGVTPITVNGGTLTLIDSVGGGGITGGNATAPQISKAGYGLEVENGTLNIGDGTSTGSFTLTSGDASNYAKTGLYIASGGTVTANQAFAVKAGNNDDGYGNAILSYGTFNGNKQPIAATGEIGIYGGTATDLNATVTDATDALTVSNATKVTITGGSYTGSRYGLWLRSTPTDDVTISGGTFSGRNAAIKKGGSDTYAGILADGYIYTNGENDNAITEETTLAAAKKLEVRRGGSSTKYSVTVSVEGTGGTANGGGTYIANATATVTATAKTGYRFVKWTENGNEVSTDAAYSFAVTANRTLVAVFELIPATPVAPVDPDPQSPPAITSPTTDQEVFVYVNSNATMSIDAKDAKTYQWYVDRGNGFEAISGATDASYTTSKVELKNDGYRYYCVVTNACGTDISPIFTLNVTKDIVTPKTGDNAQNGLWTGLIIIAAAGLCACTVVWRKRSQA